MCFSRNNSPKILAISAYYCEFSALLNVKIPIPKSFRPKANRNQMIFMKDERSKVRTLQARILEKARIYMALGVFYLGCYWL
jgi:hypothetical protein